MKVLHILDSLNRGGAEVLALDVCRNARVHGLDLTFVATGGGDLEEDFRHSGVEFIRLERRLPVDPRLAAALRRVVRERGVKVVHSHQAVEGVHAYLATRGTDVKRVLSFHLCEADAKNRVALKLLAPRMSANVAVSRDLLECLRAKAGLGTEKNFRVIYNGVDAERLRAPGRGLRGELGLTDEDLLLGMVGNFYADGRKDQLTVCRALPKLFEEFPRAHFAFVGARAADAPHVYEECVRFCREHSIKSRVHFMGKRADIPAVLGSLDIFVLSSRHEGLGIAAIEAMMVGLPTVVSDIGPLVEVAGGGEYASVFRAGDADDLARRLTELAADPARRASLGEKGRRWSLKQFGIETHIRQLLELYEEVTARP